MVLTTEQLGLWVRQHEWTPLLAVLVLVVVRLSKGDVRLPLPLPSWMRWTVPAWLRPIFATAVGGIAGAVLLGTPLSVALNNGFVAAMLAILAHEGLIETVRGGVEIPVPSFMTAPPPAPPPAIATVEPDDEHVCTCTTIPSPPPPPCDPPPSGPRIAS